MADNTLIEKRQNNVLKIGSNGLEHDVCDVHDRASGLQLLWQNCKNDLVAARLDAASSKRQLVGERIKLRQAKDQETELLAKLSTNELLVKTLQRDLRQSQTKVLEMKDAVLSKDIQLTVLNRELFDTKRSAADQSSKYEKTLRDYKEKCLEVFDLNIEIASLKEQLAIANVEMNRWPYRMLSWTTNSIYTDVCNKLIAVKKKLNQSPIKLIKRLFKMIYSSS